MKDILTFLVDEEVTELIERICNTINFNNVKLNGDSKTNISSILRHIFVELYKTKNPELLSQYLKLLNLKDKYNDKISDEIISKITKEVFQR